MNQWWVNQNQTYAHEVPGGYLWSPKTNSNGSSNRFYKAMTETQPGDVVLSLCDTWIKAVGVVTGPCQSAPKPTEFGSTGGNWNDEGWFVPVQFTELKRPVRPREHMDLLGPTLPAKYSPLQLNGKGNQGVYLAPIPRNMAVVLNRLLNGQVEVVVAGAVPDMDFDGDEEEQRVVNDITIATTEREQLIKARVGQGLFRSRVELLEPICRLTGLSDRRFLRASHVKPWSRSTDSEKLDGANGLLLAPHVDHLFDKGFISFDDDGQLRISPHLPPAVALAWSISQPKQVVPLTPAQAGFMAYHRGSILIGDKEPKLSY